MLYPSPYPANPPPNFPSGEDKLRREELDDNDQIKQPTNKGQKPG